MPRVRTPGKMIRTPLPDWAAFQIARDYPTEEDVALIQLVLPKWKASTVESLQYLAKTLGKIEDVGYIHPRQRLVLLEHAYPQDLRLKLIREKLSKGQFKFAAIVRADPGKAYAEEIRASQKGLEVRKKKSEEATIDKCDFAC